jgi:hypothetical protein
MSCGIYQRTNSDGQTVRMVWRDERPLPRWDRVSDAECHTQVDIRTGELVDMRRDSQEVKRQATAVDWARAEASLMRQGPVSLPVLQERVRQCHDCPQRMPDPSGQSLGWCNSCGCGTRQRATLDIKLTMPAVSCPLGKWGESVGSHGSIRQAINGISIQTRGIIAAALAECSRVIRPRVRRLDLPSNSR